MFNIKIIAVAGFILGLVAAFVYFDRMGYARGKDDCTVEIQRVEANNKTIRDKIESNVFRYRDAEIEEVLEKWYRD